MPVYQLRSSAYYIGAGIISLIIILFTIASYSNTPKTLLDQATRSLRRDVLADVNNATLGVRGVGIV